MSSSREKSLPAFEKHPYLNEYKGPVILDKFESHHQIWHTHFTDKRVYRIVQKMLSRPVEDIDTLRGTCWHIFLVYEDILWSLAIE